MIETESIQLEGLRAALRGDLIEPHTPDYDSARRVYNAMIERYPKLIARCTDVGDVIAAVNFARENQLLLAVRSGGHNAAGLGVYDDALVIDLSPMKGIRVDPEARTVQVQAGCTWGDVDHATHAFGLATTSGIISTTGVGGLTLGGGMGHLARQCGLTIDNLLAADMVLADGRFVSVSEEQHPDLFWAIRGGGGNFGVVTSFLFRLHPISTLIGGPTLWPLEMAADVMRFWDQFLDSAPDELNGFFAFLTVPPGPPFPEALHLQKMCGVVWCYTGPEEKADELFAPVREFGPPALHGIHPMSYPELQSAFDGLYPPGLQWYWKGDFVKDLPDEAIALHAEHGDKLPSMHSTMHLYPIDRAVHRIDKHDTAFSHRDAKYSMVIVGVDPSPANAERITSWAVDYWQALHPYTLGGAYVNFMMEEGEERIKATYGGNYERLVNIKRKYDPDNLFRVNQNIRP